MSLGKVIIYDTHTVELIVEKSHVDIKDIEAFLVFRDSYLEPPYRILYNASHEHSYSLSALKYFEKHSASNLFAVFSPNTKRHAGFDSIISFSTESIYEYFSDHQTAFSWLALFA